MADVKPAARVANYLRKIEALLAEYEQAAYERGYNDACRKLRPYLKPMADIVVRQRGITNFRRCGTSD